MYIEKNISKLKKKFPYYSWDTLLDTEDSQNCKVVIEASRKGLDTVKVCIDGSSSYLHSKYDPMAEATTIIEALELEPEDHHLLFYGVGLGYVLDVINVEKPELTYSIYEPNPLIFKRFITTRLLSDRTLESLKNIYVYGITGDTDIETYIFFRNMDYNTKAVTLPSYERLYPSNYSEFCRKLRDSVIDKRFSVGTRYYLEKLWMDNTMKNFPYTIKNGSILDLPKEIFEGKPALIVASGPSLDEELENLKRIKSEGLAYIFTAGSAIFKLAKHGIMPDAVCAIDAKPVNYDIYKSLFENPDNKVPLIFADMMYNEVVSNYNARLFNINLEGNTLEPYYLRHENGAAAENVKTAPSVAIVLLQILHKLKCDPIILVGQNLALKNEYYYAKGMDFNKEREAKEKISEKEKQETFPVEDVNGNTIYTLKDLDMMRRGMEVLIDYCPINNIINTTKGGAKIKGTRYTSLSELIEVSLNKRVVDSKWYEAEPAGYDLEYVLERHNEMLIECKKLNDIIKEMEKEIVKIEAATLKYKEKKLSDLLLEFTKTSKKLTRNKYYQTFIYPMNSLQVNLIANSLNRIAREADIVQKGKKAVKEFTEFIDTVKSIAEELEPAFNEFTGRIKELVGGA